MPNTQPLAVTQLRWVLEHAPTPTPTRGAMVALQMPQSSTDVGPPAVELRADLRRVGDLEWVYEGPVRVASDAGEGEALMHRLRGELGPCCTEVRVHARSGDVAEVTVFGELRDRGS
jgi:hypothetical protein